MRTMTTIRMTRPDDLDEEEEAEPDDDYRFRVADERLASQQAEEQRKLRQRKDDDERVAQEELVLAGWGKWALRSAGEVSQWSPASVLPPRRTAETLAEKGRLRGAERAGISAQTKNKVMVSVPTFQGLPTSVAKMFVV